MKTTENYLKLDYNLIQLGATDAIILSYIKSWRDNNKICFEKQEDISNKLNISYPTVKRLIKKYSQLGVIIKDKNGHHYKNRKSLTIDEYKLNQLLNSEPTTTQPKVEKKVETPKPVEPQLKKEESKNNDESIEFLDFHISEISKKQSWSKSSEPVRRQLTQFIIREYERGNLGLNTLTVSGKLRTLNDDEKNG